jgi:hypothetical protein
MWLGGRPIIALRNGDQDGNDATERDAGWTPLNATPMHPEYPSAAAIVSPLFRVWSQRGSVRRGGEGRKRRGGSRQGRWTPPTWV